MFGGYNSKDLVSTTDRNGINEGVSNVAPSNSEVVMSSAEADNLGGTDLGRRVMTSVVLPLHRLACDLCHTGLLSCMWTSEAT